jgi:rSAM/selenodomain-associated transferase 2
MISIIIPVYNEEAAIERTLSALPLNDGIEIIVIDGQSDDGTVDIVRKYPVKLITSSRGRALQMNAGASVAQGDILLFLHADCYLEREGFEAIKESIAKGYVGGCLNHKIDSSRFIFRIIELSGNIRAKLFKIFYGDQGIYVRKDIFEKVHGFPPFLIFEDVVFTRKMRRMGEVQVLKTKIYALPRRWEKYGIIKTTLLNWFLSVGFMLGIPAEKLGRLYKNIR